MSNSSRYHILFIRAIFFIVPLVLVAIWFKNGLMLGGGEEGLIFSNPWQSFKISQSTWAEFNTGFPQLYWLPRIPLLLFALFLKNGLNLPVYFIQAILFFILMTVGIVSVYYLSLNLLDKYPPKYLISFISSIFYLFNPFSVSQIWARGLYPQYFAFALLPLSMFLFIKGIKQRSYLYIFLIVLSSVLFSTTFGALTYIMTYWIALFFCLFYWLFLNRFIKKEIIFGLTFFIILLILWIVANAWWFLPIILEGSKVFVGNIKGSEENLGTLLGVSRNFTPDIIVRLLQRTYYYDASAFSFIYQSFFFQFLSFIPLIFVLIGMRSILKISQLSKFSFFLFFLLLGLIVSLGANPPLGWLFIWVFKHISILQSFRNPFEKFGIIYALGYSAVFAAGLVTFFEGKKYKNLAIFIIISLTCFIFAWPMWTGRVVAGPDKKIGIDIPNYYSNLNTWLNKQDMDGYRIMMTPVWSGDGAIYQWNDSIYNGIDPMMHIVNTPAVSNSAQIPFYFQFIQSIRKYMERIDTSISLPILRVKYLVNRKDAISLNEDEKKHYLYLTSKIFPVTKDRLKLESICQNKQVDSIINNKAWIICQIPQDKKDWRGIKYLHLKIFVSENSFLELAIQDQNETRIRWYGKLDSGYALKAGEWNNVVISLHAPEEYNSNIDFSKINLLEVTENQLNNSLKNVERFILEDIRFDPGNEQQLSSSEEVAQFGKLSVFKNKDTIFPPEFGAFTSIYKVNNFEELFKSSEKKVFLENTGLLLLEQNKDKDLSVLDQTLDIRVQNLDKNFNNRFWVKLDNKTKAYLILSKSFNSEWKVIPGAGRDILQGSIFNDLFILKQSFVSEKNHFVVNGYANLWKVDESNQYAVVFIPQIAADVGLKVSIFSIILLVGLTILWRIKKYTFLL